MRRKGRMTGFTNKKIDCALTSFLFLQLYFIIFICDRDLLSLRTKNHLPSRVSLITYSDHPNVSPASSFSVSASGYSSLYLFFNLIWTSLLACLSFPYANTNVVLLPSLPLWLSKIRRDKNNGEKSDRKKEREGRREWERKG